MRSKLLNFFKKPKVSVPALILVVILVIILFSSGDEKTFETTVAEVGSLKEIVSVSGTVKAADKVDLSFEVGGKLKSYSTSVGSQVSVGKELARLDNLDLFAQVQEAEASLLVQNAELTSLKEGTKPEELDLYRDKVSKAEITASVSKTKLKNSITDSFTRADDAVRNYADQLFYNPRSNNLLIVFDIADSELRDRIKIERIHVENDLVDLRSMVDNLSDSNLSTVVESVQIDLEYIRGFLADLAFAVNGLSPSTSFSQTQIDSWKTDISTARSSINTALTNLQTSFETYKTAESSLSISEQELRVAESGATNSEILAKEAQVKAAQAALSRKRADYSKTIITAPFSGLVTKKHLTEGEIVSAGSPVVSLISISQFEVEVNIPEVDISKVNVGDQAIITLDAYGNGEKFTAQVISVDPAETVIEGVSTYKTVLQFVKQDERIRSGMTADVEITTDAKANALIIPVRAVIRQDGKEIVRIPDGENNYKEVEITTGIRGEEGKIEVVSGLSEGEEVITLVRDSG